MHTNLTDAKQRGMQGRRDMMERFSLDAVGNLLLQHQRRIEKLFSSLNEPGNDEL